MPKDRFRIVEIGKEPVNSSGKKRNWPTIVALALLVVIGAAFFQGSSANPENTGSGQKVAVARPTTPIPTSPWSYRATADRITGTKTYSATTTGDQGDPILGGVVVGVQSSPDVGDTVWFGNLPHLPDCDGTCLIRYKTDKDSGDWLARESRDGEHLILVGSNDAITTLRRAKYVTVDLGNSGQPRFITASLAWPLSKARHIEER